MDIIDHVVGDLDSVPWESPEVHCNVEDILVQVGRCRDELLRAIAERASLGEPIQCERVAELKSWKLVSRNNFTLALNEFVPWPGPNDRTSIHAHQHKGFISVLGLNGGYSQSDFVAPKPLDDYEDGEPFGNLQSSVGPAVSRNRVLTYGLDTLHAISDFADDTLTLAVYGPMKRDRTVLFDLRTGCTRINYTNDTKTLMLGNKLRGLIQDES